MKLLPAVIIGIVLGLYLQRYSTPIFVYYPPQVIVEAPVVPPTDSEVIQEVVRVFKDESRHVIVQAINIFYCESGLRWNAQNWSNNNGSNDGGVAQINSIHGMSMEDRLDYKKNIAKAYEIYLRRGWRAWACASKLGYL